MSGPAVRWSDGWWLDAGGDRVGYDASGKNNPSGLTWFDGWWTDADRNRVSYDARALEMPGYAPISSTPAEIAAVPIYTAIAARPGAFVQAPSGEWFLDNYARDAMSDVAGVKLDDNGPLQAFSKTIGLALGVTSLIAGGLQLAANAGIAGAGETLAASGYQSLASSLWSGPAVPVNELPQVLSHSSPLNFAATQTSIIPTMTDVPLLEPVTVTATRILPAAVSPLQSLFDAVLTLPSVSPLQWSQAEPPPLPNVPPLTPGQAEPPSLPNPPLLDVPSRSTPLPSPATPSSSLGNTLKAGATAALSTLAKVLSGSGSGSGIFATPGGMPTPVRYVSLSGTPTSSVDVGGSNLALWLAAGGIAALVLSKRKGKR